MVISKRDNLRCQIQIGDGKINILNKYNYLGIVSRDDMALKYEDAPE